MGVTTPSTTGIPLDGRHVLVVTPHPDDESLAVGGLVQHAVQQGARVTLLQVTDGDNNPWPQRWLERRWRIGTAERARWGARRVEEVQQAMQHLGLPPESLQRMVWPDLGVCGRLLDQPADAVGAFATVLRRLAPDVVVLPDLADRHPDHGACHVLVRLAMATVSLDVPCLTYLVHGAVVHADLPCVVALDAGMCDAKRRAVMAHRTQVALSRRRLLGMVGPEERLYRVQPPEHARWDAPSKGVTLPWRPSPVLRPWLQLAVAHVGGCQAWAWGDAPLSRSRGHWQLELPHEVRRYPVFARLASRVRTPWIFDHWGWCDLTAMPPAGQAGERLNPA